MRRLLLVAATALLGATPALAQLGELVSPGPLSAAHAKLEGLKSCEKCHEKGNRVAASRCLACHRDVASRIAAKKGVHRDVKDECAACHAEHAGRDAELRPFETKGFDHAGETGFPLDARHAPLAEKCASCHRTRSFLKLSPACASCHADVHKGALGAACASCHSTAVPFKQASAAFDHSKARFALTGAHAKVACAKCHAGGVFRGLKFASCADCHQDPHRKALGADCSSCHDTASFRTTKVDHAKTAFPLRGRHAAVACVACHRESAAKVRPKSDTCAACHRDPHRGEFQKDCAACHDERGFRGAPFDHAARTRFPLTGRHAAARCAACHVPQAAGAPAGPKGRPAADVSFRGLKADCAACHKDPHRGALGTACAACHGTESFRPKEFRHPRFPELFEGAHQGLACEKCHGAPKAGASGPPVPVSERTYRGLSTACASCHRDPHLGQVGASCESCHAVTGAKFAAVRFDHAKTPFPLAGRHAALACEKCHAKETARFPSGNGTAVRLKGLGTSCAGCHKDPHLGQLGAACASCHSPETFKVAAFRHSGPADFWKGGHAKAACAACHKPETGSFPAGKGTAVRYKGGGEACATCHADPHRGALGASCETCHAPTAAWKTASRAFHKTSWPLEGKHLLVPCASCHVKGQTKGTPRDCASCHWYRRQDDRFRTQLGLDCASCHRPASWKAVTWTHAAATGFALSGAHAGIDCAKCHEGGVFRKSAASGCVGCHRKDYDRATEPNHAAAGFPTTCETCHRVSDVSWHQARFDHASVFPLNGKHATAACASCHASGVYRGTARDCAGCHLPLYQKATNPSHILAGFPTACETCHRSSDPAWTGISYSHAKWPLAGRHAGNACTACHRSGVFQGLPSSCVSCHQADYQKAASPNHAAAGFPTACETCHKVSDPSWREGKFDHASVFPLNGKHATAACASCHASGVYRGTARDCAGCHLPLYQKATNPSHILAGFPTACETCHRSSDPAWTGISYSHAKWPLAGRHAGNACTACHRSGVFQGLPSSCVSCHQADYQKAASPNHAAAGFPTACETCHKVSDPSWRGGAFAHAKWPLVGRHLGPACAACHASGVFQGLPSDCVACHLPQYQSTKDPNHAAAGFPTTCATCHRLSDPSWQQGTFSHGAYFALVGRHATAACASCHGNGVYRGTSRDCVGCHLPRYQATRSPNHAAAGFPTTCETCHRATDTSWDQGTFNHTWFPITTGRHSGNPCSACHTSPSNYAVFTCLTCHGRAETDRKHQGRNGYRYESAACYACHPQGRAD